jgi:adhesin/invasin
MSASGGNTTFSAPSGATDANGVFVSRVNSTQAQTETVTASIGPGAATLSTSVRFVAGAASASTSTLAINPNSTVADNSNTLIASLTLLDAYGNPIQGMTPTYSASGTRTTISSAVATSASGQSQVTYRTDLAQNENALVTAGGISLAAGMAFYPGPPAAAYSTLSASPNALPADGNTASYITATVKDSQANPISGVYVTLSASGTNNNFTPLSGSTDSLGRITSQLSSNTVQTETLTATVPSGLNIQTPVSFVLGPPAAAYSSLSVSPTTQVANGNSQVNAVVHLADNQNRVLPGQALSFSISGSAGPLSQTRTSADANGNASVSLTSVYAGNSSLFARASGLMLSNSVVFSPNATYCSANPNYRFGSVNNFSDVLQNAQVVD